MQVDVGSIPGLERFPLRSAQKPSPAFFLENPMDRGAWIATVHGVSNSWDPMTEATQHSRDIIEFLPNILNMNLPFMELLNFTDLVTHQSPFGNV